MQQTLYALKETVGLDCGVHKDKTYFRLAWRTEAPLQAEAETVRAQAPRRPGAIAHSAAAQLQRHLDACPSYSESDATQRNGGGKQIAQAETGAPAGPAYPTSDRIRATAPRTHRVLLYNCPQRPLTPCWFVAACNPLAAEGPPGPDGPEAASKAALRRAWTVTLRQSVVESQRLAFPRQMRLEIDGVLSLIPVHV